MSKISGTCQACDVVVLIDEMGLYSCLIRIADEFGLKLQARAARRRHALLAFCPAAACGAAMLEKSASERALLFYPAGAQCLLSMSTLANPRIA